MSAWSEMERMALLGTRRESIDIPPIAAAVDKVLSILDSEDAEHALLSAAGTLDLYEQIGRMPARLRPDPAARLPQESMAACPPEAAQYIAQMLEGPLRGLMPEFLQELHKAGLRIPETLLPNMLAYGYKRTKVRPFILPVLGSRGRWLAGHHQSWHYAAVDPNSWPSIRSAWEGASIAQRPSLVAQLRAADPAQGRALVESTWRGENDQLRLLLIKQLETHLSMEDEPLLETALDDRSRLVRRRAAELLAHLPGSRLCLRMIDYVPRYLSWTPGQTRMITVSLPQVSPAMRRNGIVGASSKVAARVRSQEIIQLLGGVPLDYWTDSWDARPRAILGALSTTSWPRTLTSGFSLAAVRQKDSLWARAIVNELGITRVTAKLIPVLNSRDVKAHTLRALSEIDPAEIDRDSALVAIMRRWPASWDTELGERLVELFSGHFRATAQARAPNNLLRELFFKLARQAEPELLTIASHMLGDSEKLGCWRNTAVEFLHILRFRRDMLGALTTKPPRSYAATAN